MKCDCTEPYGRVYIITNSVNGKVYIGQTIFSIEWRFERHISDSFGPRKLNTHFARAIRKYGKESFSVRLLEECFSKEQLTDREYYWIAFYDSVHNGYNETSAKFKCGGNTYQSKTKRERRLISKKISNSNSGARNGNHSAVKCLNVKTGRELTFDTVSECCEYFKEPNHNMISRRASKLTRILYREEWKIAYVEDSYDMKDRQTFNANFSGKRRVTVTDLKTGEVSEYESLTKAEKAMSLPKKTLANKFYRYKASKFVYDRRFRIESKDV